MELYIPCMLNKSSIWW